jgi:tRNA-specific 2-thiouridylase
MRAISLFSGGLDSMLAVKLIKEQGIDVTALFIDVGFGSRDDKSEILKSRAQMVGADFEIVDTKEQFVKEILFSPKHGYGKNFNPCIDCHGNMIKVAKALMPKYEASFIITGEVVGQRPMSQRAEAIKQVNRLSNDLEEKLVLRPLSAKVLEITRPEMMGWVERDKLLDITGRSREVQLRLAEEYGFEEYESPGGGCLLTDANFTKRLKNFTKDREFLVEDIEVLKVGRHFNLPDGVKLIVGRHKEDNERIEQIDNPDFETIRLKVTGPLSLVSKSADWKMKKLAAKIALTYAKSNPDTSYIVSIGDVDTIATPFASKEDVKKYMI